MAEMDDDAPLSNGDTGRDKRGRFLPGNAGGPGNPRAAAVQKWRSQLIEIITPEDFAEVIAALVDKAKAGEAWAVRELLDRTVGKPTPMEDDEGGSSAISPERAALISLFNLDPPPLNDDDLKLSLPPGLPQPDIFYDEDDGQDKGDDEEANRLAENC